MNEGLSDEEQVKELIYVQGETISWYDDGSQYFKGCDMTVQIMFVLIGLESQNRTMREITKLFHLEIIQKQNGFPQSGMNFFSWAVQAVDARPPAGRSKMGGWNGCPPGPVPLRESMTSTPFLTDLLSHYKTEHRTKQQIVCWAHCLRGACCTRE